MDAVVLIAHDGAHEDSFRDHKISASSSSVISAFSIPQKLDAVYPQQSERLPRQETYSHLGLLCRVSHQKMLPARHAGSVGKSKLKGFMIRHTCQTLRADLLAC